MDVKSSGKLREKLKDVEFIQLKEIHMIERSRKNKSK